MAIANGQVVVEIVTPGPNDAMCCGTLKVRKTLALSGGMLTEVGSEELGTVSLDDLMGTSWLLERIDQQPILADTTVTANFAEGQISGSAGCNNYNGPVTSDGGQHLAIGPLVTTRMACPEPIMAQETQVLTALQAASQWSYQPGQMVILYAKEDGSLGRLYFDPAATDEQAAAPAPMTVSGDVTATEVITFTPTAVPAETREGSCFANAIGLGRADAYRCTVGNEIFDPCFVVDDAPTVVCGANPTTGDIGFVLALTEPLPAPEAAGPAKPWLVELAGGQVCGLMTGTVVGVDGRIAPYGCPDQSYLFEDFQRGDIWMAEKAVIGLNDAGFFIEQSQMVPIARVWQ
jgi:heat shock protein HslJ